MIEGFIKTRQTSIVSQQSTFILVQIYIKLLF